MRKWIVVLSGLAVLAVVNYAIYQKEQVLTNGRVVLLELVPVDPRSLMQGDYMALRFRLQTDIPYSREILDGLAVVAVDQRGVAIFRRLDDGRPTANDELKIYFRARAGTAKLGTNAFFFQEGDARFYSNARFGEARVAGDGQILLTGLRDANLQKLGPSR